jgi:hypothetical protein
MVLFPAAPLGIPAMVPGMGPVLLRGSPLRVFNSAPRRSVPSLAKGEKESRHPYLHTQRVSPFACVGRAAGASSILFRFIMLHRLLDWWMANRPHRAICRQAQLARPVEQAGHLK